MPLQERFEVQAAALALLVLIAYANALGSSFHFDDASIFAEPRIVSRGFGWGLFRLEQTRPLTYLTFHWNYLLGGENPLLYHFVNLLLHAANSIVLLALARKYLGSSGSGALAAGCAAAVFALHPLETESVTYVFARSTLLSTHFALWTIWLYSRGKYWWSGVLFGVSLLAKEETIALPGLLILLEIFERKTLRLSRDKLRYFGFLAGVGALFAGRLFYAIYTYPVAIGVGRVRGMTAVQYLMTQCRVIWIYLRLIVAPFDLNLDRDVPLSTGLLSPWTTLAGFVALAILLAILIWWAWKTHSVAALWALGYFVLLSPSSSVVAQADVIFEHRTYLPMVAMSIALGFLLAEVPRARLIAGFAVLIPLMVLGTVARNSGWYDEKSFWTDIAEKSPQKGRSWQGLAQAYAGEPLKAREYLRKGLEVDPGNVDLHTNYGIALMAANDPAEALVHFDRALALSEATADRWNNIGGAYYQLHQIGPSLESFRGALKLDPCSFNARRNVMMVYSQGNDPHGVWLAGEVPAGCAMIPEQARELEALRRRAGRP